jgi:hypothetical protein
MARQHAIQHIRTTRANLDTQKNASGLLVGELYLITNETPNKLAAATSVNTYIDINSSGGGHAIQNNGTTLTTQSNLNLTGNFTITTNDATTDSINIPLSNNIGKDWYINQNVYPALEWIWYHTDGYWYLVNMVLNTTASYVGTTNTKFKVYKTKDWQTLVEVCSYENTAYAMATHKICLDSSGNILVIGVNGNNIFSVFFNASSSYATTLTTNIANNATYAPETTISLQVSADNRFGVAFFQKHSGSTSYSQLMYVERSAGINGTWGTPEIIGSTPVRAATADATNSIQLFYTSTNEPIIAFKNNQSVTSSKMTFAKKVSGTWTVYDSSYTNIYSSIIDSSNNIYICADSNGLIKFTYATNSYSQFIAMVAKYSAIDVNNDIYYTSNYNSLSVPASSNIWYGKNNSNTLHRFIRGKSVIGAVSDTDSLGVKTVIPYSRQRLASAYHLVIRTDGFIFMEII